MDLDSILEDVGGFGRLQFLIVGLFLPLVMSLGSFAYWSQILILLVPDHHCRLPSDINSNMKNLTLTGQCAMSQVAEALPSEQSYAASDPWASYNSWKTIATVFHYGVSNSSLAAPTCDHGWEYDFSFMYPTAATENNWVCNDDWKVNFLHTIYWIGSTVGYLVSGFFLDRFGRWKVALVLVLVQTVSTISAIFSSGIFPLFCALRFLSGLSSMPMQSSAYTLAVEVIASRKRKIVGVGTAIYWLLTAAASPGLALLLRDWHWILAVAAVPGPVLLILMAFVPESPSWLLSQNQTEEAFRVFSRISKFNRVADDTRLQKMKEYALSSSLPVRRENVLKTTISALRMPNVRRKTLVLFVAWFSVCLSYHGNNLSQSSSGSNVFLLYSLGSLMEIPVCFVYLFTVDTLGRKPPIFGSLTCVAILAPLIHLINPGATWTRFGMNIVVRGLFSLGYNVLFQWGCELFPTALRGRGIFLMRTVGDVGTSIVPFILTANSAWPFMSSMVFSILSLLCCFFVLWLPETKDQPLPQTINEAEAFGNGRQSLMSSFPCCNRCETSSSRLSKADLFSSTSRLSISSDAKSNGSINNTDLPGDFNSVCVHL